MRYFLGIGYTGLCAVIQYPLRSVATIACLLAILGPYLAGLGVSQGVLEQAEASVRFGADLYVSGEAFGKEAPVPAKLVTDLKKIDGVTAVVPRIVGRIVLGRDFDEVVLVGVPAEHFPAGVTCIEGELPHAGQPDKPTVNEFVVGTELARRLKLHVGSRIAPFYHNPKGDRVSLVVGIFKADVSIWQANMILTTFDTASAICNQEERATDLLVWCRPGYQASVHDAILALSGTKPEGASSREGQTPASAKLLPHLLVTSREDLAALLPRGLLHREGIFNLHFLVAFCVGILTILVTSGFGTSERRREIGILKATGWQTDEILVRGLVESAIHALIGIALATILAYIWLRLLNGYWIAGLFLPGLDAAPRLTVPFRLTPVPVLLAFVLGLVLVLSGTLYTTWRAAVVPPRDAMR